jgi:hypothetical protein
MQKYKEHVAITQMDEATLDMLFALEEINKSLDRILEYLDKRDKAKTEAPVVEKNTTKQNDRVVKNKKHKG